MTNIAYSNPLMVIVFIVCCSVVGGCGETDSYGEAFLPSGSSTSTQHDLPFDSQRATDNFSTVDGRQGPPDVPHADETVGDVRGPGTQATADAGESVALQPGISEATRGASDKAQAANTLTDASQSELRNRDQPRVSQSPVKPRQFRAEGPDGALRVSYDDIDLLKILNMDRVTAAAPEKMPSWLRKLNGKRIRIRGFMYPPFQETGIPVFVLARDNQICCFGRNPKIYDLIKVTMRKGTTTDYIENRPFDVVGNFRINAVELEDGRLAELYYLEDARVFTR